MSFSLEPERQREDAASSFEAERGEIELRKAESEVAGTSRTDRAIGKQIQMTNRLRPRDAGSDGATDRL